MNSALLLLEFQNDYFPEGRMPLEKSVEASMKAQAVLNAYRQKKQHVIHVQHISTHPDATSLLPCTRGADFYPTLKPVKGELHIKKHYPNSFKDTTLLNQLIKNQINHLIICGMMTEQTIDSTVRAAYDLGFTCTILHDACAARQIEFKNNTILPQQVQSAFLGALQATYASILSSQEYLQKIGAYAPAHQAEEAVEA